MSSLLPNLYAPVSFSSNKNYTDLTFTLKWVLFVLIFKKEAY